MERLYAFRHVNLLTKAKVGAALSVGCAVEKDVEAWLGRIIAFSGMDVVGTMSAKGTPCCFVCGIGRDLQLYVLECLQPTGRRNGFWVG